MMSAMDTHPSLLWLHLACPVSNRYTKKIVCLANSRKPPSGRCVAGREVTASGFGAWIRPVSARPTEEISLEERRYMDGRDPSLLDLIAITMNGPQPHRHQQENHLINADAYWVKNGAVGWQELQAAVEDPAGPLWLNESSSYHGKHDRVPEASLDAFSRSLYLVRPDQLQIVIAPEGGNIGPPRRRVRAQFNLCGYSYKMVVTDPLAEGHFLAGKDGEHAIGEALLCISLSEIFHGYAYKLAAAVFTRQRAGA
jgi:hypothetical protein